MNTLTATQNTTTETTCGHAIGNAAWACIDCD